MMKLFNNGTFVFYVININRIDVVTIQNNIITQYLNSYKQITSYNHASSNDITEPNPKQD
ncbi:ORF61 [Helicoverpa armigera SNPV]|uniref:ORF62 n=2 Tax=Alphabaculovirus helarmigerae TaxID=3047947 RepID=Q8V5T5_9ABAC|nr:ORF62 [Helicoverpa zea single nucleopolyhedrovirus]ADZ04872.1 ORF62 [Helicoverpa armigera SNPV]ADZ04869.1 ORF62 [Helicoverpa zea single nucleopolyhedrovirus]ADZ04874.1 ORF62 [Helicoverpa armigera SNPV]AHN05437.1 ORF62 [Helicoverpa zea single nucleopolyhedrovirus]